MILLNYFRYSIVIFLLVSLFYSYTLTINKSTLQAKIDKKLPKQMDKKGLMVTVEYLEIMEVKDNIVNSKIIGSVQISKQSKWSKFLPKKSIHFTLYSKTKPKLYGNAISFELHSFKLIKYIGLKEVKGLLQKKIESIRIPIKKLKKLSWFVSVKHMKFKDDASLLLSIGVSKFLICLLIPLFLLREIGILLIEIYQRFFSARKNYRCAKGQLYQNGTCSSVTKEAFVKYGFIAGIKAYRKSTQECKKAYKTLKKEESKESSVCDSFFCSGCSGVSDSSSTSTSICDIGSAVHCDIGSC